MLKDYIIQYLCYLFDFIANCEEEIMGYFSLICAFLLILILVIAGMQNTTSVSVHFLAWKMGSTVLALILYSSLLGGAIIGILPLPKLAEKHIKLNRINK